MTRPSIDEFTCSEEWMHPTSSLPSSVGSQPLSKWERLGLMVLLLITALFGGIVELRSAFLKRPMTDLQVFLRAAWAVRSGADLYTITDVNDWHYHYPPLFAILMVPLADAPAGVERTWMIPLAVSAGLWYVFSVICLAWGVHTLARALEETVLAPVIGVTSPGTRRWWALRVLPVLACLTQIGGSLARGQVTLLLLALLCAMIAAALRGRSFKAGCWLAGAICLKVIPAYLLIYPLWRREGRWLLGCLLGLLIGLVVIPGLVFGPRQTLIYFEEWNHALLQPSLGTGEDRSRAEELLEATATDNQSLLMIAHNSLHLDRATRPPRPDTSVRSFHVIFVAVFSLLTVLTLGWRRSADGAATVIVLGSLVVGMILFSPVCHLHYFALSVPLLMGLVAVDWMRTASSSVSGTTRACLIGYGMAITLPSIPGMYWPRELGLAMYGSFFIWLAGLVMLRGGLRLSYQLRRAS